jgi:predicted amidohydrolase
MQDLNITLVQAELYWEEKEKNLQHFEALLQNVTGTDIIVLPEMFSTGFSMQPAMLAETMQGETVRWMREMAAAKHAVVTGSAIIEDTKQYFNRLLWVPPEGEMMFYDKRHLFSLGDEHKHYASGEKRIFPEVNAWKLLPLICYDLRFPVWSRQSSPYTEMGNHPYDILIYVANWPEKRIYAWKQLLIARAIENQCYVVGVNRVGTDGNGIYHTGNSCVLNAMGEILFETERDECVKTITLSKQDILTTRRKLPFLHDRDEYEIKI